MPDSEQDQKESTPGTREFTFVAAEYPDRRRRLELLGLGVVLWPVGLVLVFWVLGTTFDIERALSITDISFLLAALYLSLLARRTRRLIRSGAGPRA
jgi:hypothetical protein